MTIARPARPLLFRLPLLLALAACTIAATPAAALTAEEVSAGMERFQMAGFCSGVAAAAAALLPEEGQHRAAAMGRHADAVALDLIARLGLDHKEARPHTDQGREETQIAHTETGDKGVYDLIYFCHEVLER